MADLPFASADVQITDESTGNKALVTAEGKLQVEASVTSSSNTIIRDGTNPANLAAVDGSGRLQVSNPAPAPPAGTTLHVSSFEFDTISSGGQDTGTYVIPNGENFTLQRVETGAYIQKKESSLQVRVRIYWQPNGDATGQELLAVLYMQGYSEGQRDFEREFLGDGVGRFLVEVTNWSSDISNSTTFIRGYHEI